MTVNYSCVVARVVGTIKSLNCYILNIKIRMVKELFPQFFQNLYLKITILSSKPLISKVLFVKRSLDKRWVVKCKLRFLLRALLLYIFSSLTFRLIRPSR